MAVTGSLQLLNKRLVLINTAQVIGGANDRGEFNVPIPQQLQDPTANDLVYKMYIQSLTLQNEQPGVNVANNKFRIQLSVTGLGPDIPDGIIGDNIDVELPTGDFNAAYIVDHINYLLARPRQVGTGNNWILPKFAVQGIPQERVYYPKINQNNPTLPFGTNGSYLCFVPQATNARANFNGEGDAPAATPAQTIDPPANANLLNGVRLSIIFADPAGKANRSNLLLGFPSQSIAIMQPIGTGFTKSNGAVLYGISGDQGFVPPDATNSLAPLNARAWRSRAPMLVDDFSELYLETDLPTNNYDVKKQNGLNESHVTAVIPITGGLGTRVQYLDDKGINGAFQRNQSTITRLSVKLTNKYGEKVIPSSDWTMVLAIEAYQDHWKTMQDIQMASQDFHGEQLKLAKLQLLHSYFHTQSGQPVMS